MLQSVIHRLGGGRFRARAYRDRMVGRGGAWRAATPLAVYDRGMAAAGPALPTSGGRPRASVQAAPEGRGSAGYGRMRSQPCRRSRSSALTVSRPSPQMTRSRPPPRALSRSCPPAATSLSRPRTPCNLSLPAPALSLSLPAPPRKRSAPDTPVSRSAPPSRRACRSRGRRGARRRRHPPPQRRSGGPPLPGRHTGRRTECRRPRRVITSEPARPQMTSAASTAPNAALRGARARPRAESALT